MASAPDGPRPGHPPVQPAPVPDLMWQSAGLVREAGGLAALLATLEPLAAALDAAVESGERVGEPAWRDANLARVGSLIARAAARRTESRGGHRRADFPDRDDVHWRVHVADIRSL